MLPFQNVAESEFPVKPRDRARPIEHSLAAAAEHLERAARELRTARLCAQGRRAATLDKVLAVQGLLLSSIMRLDRSNAWARLARGER